MFYHDFGNILLISYFYGINPAQAENPIFYILIFQGPKRCPNDLIIYEHQFLEGTKRGSEGSEQAEARGLEEGGPRGQGIWKRGTHHLGPRGSVAVDLFSEPPS